MVLGVPILKHFRVFMYIKRMFGYHNICEKVQNEISWPLTKNTSLYFINVKLCKNMLNIDVSQTA